MNQRTNVGRSVDVVISIDNCPLGGQQGANLTRQAQVINITNRINDEWAENLTGVKSWSITCAGLYVVNDKSFSLLEDAFMNNKKVEVSIVLYTYTISDPITMMVDMINTDITSFTMHAA